MSIAQLIRSEFDNNRDLSGIGGVETGQDAAEFLLLGANSVQVRSARQTLPHSPATLVVLHTPYVPLFWSLHPLSYNPTYSPQGNPEPARVQVESIPECEWASRPDA